MKMKLPYGCLAALLLSALGAAVQGQPPATDVPSFTAQGAFVAIVVTDLDASVHWYESNLGLHLVKRGKSPQVPAETVVLGGLNLFVELIHHEGKALPRVDNEASVPRLLKAGVIVSQRDFDAVATYCGNAVSMREYLKIRKWECAALCSGTTTGTSFSSLLKTSD